MTADPTDQNESPSSENSENASGAMSCIECGAEYSFTPEQKQEFASRGFQPPKRCAECRMKRRRKRTGGPQDGQRDPQRDGHSEGVREDGREARDAQPREQQSRRKQRPAPQPQQQSESRSGNRPQRSFQPNQDPGSFVSQGESERSRRESRYDDPEDPPHLSVAANSTWNKAPTHSANSEADAQDDDNFGNSIHYKGPGVDTRFGTAWDGGPNYAPWEGAHGYLLTHHEAEVKRKQQHQKRNDRNDRNDRNGNDRNGNEQKRGGRSNHQNNNNNRKKENSRSRRMAFDIVCATCGTATQVPFKPIPGKAVYCRDCYRKARQENAPANTGSNTTPGDSTPGSDDNIPSE